MKNPSPNILAMYVSLAVAGLTGIAFYVSSFFYSGEFNPFYILATVALVFIFSYLLIRYVMEIFIYRKIKLIYKSISHLKSTKENVLTKIDLNKDIIADVSREVTEWELEKDKEIDQLKKMEIFRKEFLGNVSHELKTPLFNIQGYIHTLLDGGLDDKEVNVHYLQRAAKSVERLCLIVDDLEVISKLEAGEIGLDMRTFDIHDLINDVFESVEMRAKEKNISLSFKDGSDRSFYVYADKDRIRQVIVNLIVNSVKYGKQGGNTSVGLYDMHENILIEVSDNGIGIGMEHLPRLFERFYRIDKSRSREQGGTGLGLSIVKHILEAHQQTINVRSTIGIGSTFAFTLKKAE